jgi:L-ascorbate metabolism protein UlaG (beta-lactamase superfamily)
LGHATVLINFFGVTILTDPVFFSRVGLGYGPFVLGPKRYVACALPPRDLPRIDLVLLSHGHMDHMDLRSLRRVVQAGAIITARNSAEVFERIRFGTVDELAWAETREMETPAGPLKVSAFKLRHWGARMRWDTHRTYNAYVVERNGVRICFAGDTARTPAHELSSCGRIDLMIAPIGAYNPWITSHCTPEEAIAMADEAGARFVLPVHHQTFRLSWEPLEEPAERFRQALIEQPDRAALTQIGETFVLPE